MIVLLTKLRDYNMFWKKKRLYCLKFNKTRLEKRLGKVYEGYGDFVYEYIITTSKTRAVKKSKLLKEGKCALVNIREMIIE
jgi:hypothetical protein